MYDTVSEITPRRSWSCTSKKHRRKRMRASFCAPGPGTREPPRDEHGGGDRPGVNAESTLVWSVALMAGSCSCGSSSYAAVASLILSRMIMNHDRLHGSRRRQTVPASTLPPRTTFTAFRNPTKR